MVWKCCVPGCTLSGKFPVHRFPSESTKAEVWLRIIKRTDMIGEYNKSIIFNYIYLFNI